MTSPAFKRLSDRYATDPQPTEDLLASDGGFLKSEVYLLLYFILTEHELHEASGHFLRLANALNEGYASHVAKLILEPE